MCVIHKHEGWLRHSINHLSKCKHRLFLLHLAVKVQYFLMRASTALKRQCWRSLSQMIPARPHLLFSQPNYGSHPAHKRRYVWRMASLANESAVCCRLARKRSNHTSISSVGHAFYAFSGKNVSSCSSLAVSCNRTVLWDGESHVCRCKGKFSTPKLLLWELGQWIWWLFSGIFAEK